METKSSRLLSDAELLRRSDGKCEEFSEVTQPVRKSGPLLTINTNAALTTENRSTPSRELDEEMEEEEMLEGRVPREWLTLLAKYAHFVIILLLY